LLRVCAQWASVSDVWRLQHSTHSHILDLHAHRPQSVTDDAAGDDVHDDLNIFVESGCKVGLQCGVVDCVLLHLYALCPLHSHALSACAFTGIGLVLRMSQHYAAMCFRCS
jgi:hypothetical protein